MKAIRAQWVNPGKTRVQVEYENGAVSEFPTNEPNYLPWSEVSKQVEGGTLVIGDYAVPKKLTASQRRELGIPDE